MLSLPGGMYILFVIFGVSFFIVVLALVDLSLGELGSRIAENLIVGATLGGGIAFAIIDLPGLSTFIESLPK